MKNGWKKVLSVFLVCLMVLPGFNAFHITASSPVSELVDISKLPGVVATANASETTDLTPDKVLDGILNYAGKVTRWASSVGLGTKWIMINLGSSWEFSEIILDWERKNATNYIIETSTNGTNFTTQKTFNSAPADYRQSIVFDTPVTARYIRLTITDFVDTGIDRNGANISWWTVSLYAFEIYAYAQSAVATVSSSKITTAETALLDVTAKNFTNPSYQWYTNTVNSTIGGIAIAGAILDKYSFTTTVDSTYYFYCVVSGAEGTVTSNIVPLTVTVVPPSYEVYPIPQYTKSLGDSFTITSEVNLVIEDGIDNATVDFAEKILNEHSIGYSVSNTVVNDKTNIMLGINGSGKATDTYVNNNVTYNKSLFTNAVVFDKYLLSITKGTSAGLIAVLGEHTDAVFFGLATLSLIFDQIANKTIETAIYEDYANLQLRGFIEGYYGNPWSYDNRKSLMDLGGRFKMNGYIYAPKDEPYHNSQWRTLYPTAELAKIKELVDKGIETKCRFIWAIHPAMSSAITFGANYNNDLNVLLNKFNQLYSVGVRDFAVCCDDVSLGTAATTGNNHLMLMNDINTWAINKGDIKTLAFCPTIYNRGSVGSNVAYLNAISNMPSTVQIIWTGDGVFGNSTKAAFDYINPIIKRKALMWLNWPVTDNNRGRTSLGKGECLQTGNDQMFGIVSNPMENAELSKVSLFAIANFAWNVFAYDADQSWIDSFKYIAPEVADSYLAVANHINYVNLGVSESENIAADLSAFESAVASSAPLDAIGRRLVVEFDKVYYGTEDILMNGNPELVKEIYPWAKCLGYLVLSAKETVLSAMGIRNGDNWDALRNAVSAVSDRGKSRQFTTMSLGSLYSVSAGIKRIAPFTDRMINVIKPMVEALLPIEGGGAPAVFTNVSSLKDTPVTKSGTVVSIMNRTNISLADEEYLGFDLTAIESVYNYVLNASAGNLTLQTSVNAFEWTDVTPPGIKAKARYIRVVNNTGAPVTFNLTSLAVSLNSFASPVVTNNYNTSSYPNGIYEGQPNYIFDQNLATRVWYASAQSNGKYVRIDMGGITDIDSITIVEGENEGDYFYNGNLQVSLDGNSWTTVYTFTGTSLAANFPDRNPPYRSRTVSNIGRQARYIQLISTVNWGNWLRLQEVLVNGGAVLDEAFEKRLGDGKIDTSYTPDASAGSFIYMLSQDVNDLSQIGVMQQPGLTASTKVEIRTSKGWKDAGSLNGFYTVFDVSEEDFVYAMRFTWDTPEDVPTIIYMFKTLKGNKPFIDPRIYKVVFEVGEGVVTEKSVIEGSYVIAPKVVKPAYILDGWYEDQVKWDFSAPVVRDLVLRPKWMPSPVPLFTDNDGNPIDPLSSDRVNAAFAFENTGDAAMTLDMYVAVYDTDHKMRYLEKSESVKIPQGDIGLFQISLTMPENAAGTFRNDGYSISVFIWDSVTFIPVTEKYSE
jgi:hyaluronoglucosaminidase